MKTKVVMFLFTKYEIEYLDEMFEELESWPKSDKTYCFAIEQFDKFFDAIRKVKRIKNVKNGTLAMMQLLNMVDKIKDK